MQLYLGDCLDVLQTLADNSVDSVVTDPPYGLSFMGREWDYDVPSVEIWAECLRVLKPGGHLLAFAGTRTQHRMCVRIEDAGFDIRDMIAWVYGSGFPKSLDVSKAINRAVGAEREVIGVDPQAARRNKTTSKFSDVYGSINDAPSCPLTAPATEAAQQWDGWGTALKPALEPITMARKPLDGTVAANVLRHGTGGLNINGCRVGDAGGTSKAGIDRGAPTLNAFGDGLNTSSCGKAIEGLGRWPANLIHDGSEEVLAAFPESDGSGSARTLKRGEREDEWGMGSLPGELRDAGKGSAARFFYCAKSSKKDRNEGLDSFTPQTTSDGRAVAADNAHQHGKTERANHHPTVKPTDLMRYLCRLVTPPGGVVLDPFAGSGSTGKGALLEGFQFIGIERELEYWLIAHARLTVIDTSVSER